MICMHIGFLTPEYVTPATPSGGLANYLKKTGQALVQRGNDVSIIVLSRKNKSWEDNGVIVYEIKKLQIPSILSQVPLFGIFVQTVNQILGSYQVSRTTWRIHKKQPFDILQASSYMAPGYKLLKNKHIPVVCRVSSYTPLLAAAYGVKRNFADYLANWLEIRQVRDADGAFAPSQFLATIYNRVEGCFVKTIRTLVDFEIHDNFDFSFYNENLVGMRYLLYFGQLSRIKGVDLLAEALPPILGKYESLHVVLIGRDDGFTNSEKIFDGIKSNCRKYQNRVHYYPPLPKNLLFPVVSNAVAVLMPSRVDNYPNVCLEALSLGIPVIGTYDSSLDEMIVEGETGFLAENGSSESLTKAILRLLDKNPEEIMKIKENIFNQINSIKRADRISELLEYYKTIIKNFQMKR